MRGSRSHPRNRAGFSSRRVPRRVRVLALSVVLVGSVVSACVGPFAAKDAAGTLRLESCVRASAPARCGTVRLPENRVTGAGRTIPIRVIVIPDRSPTRHADPVVWFAGGPGGSAVDMIDRVRPLMGDTHRDLVFIEQRGTGASNLSCPSFPPVLDPTVLGKSVTACLKSLGGADLRYYSTGLFADDVDQILSLLHYRTANLVGISYGATAEQVFLLRHPAKVRTMTLLSGSLLSSPVFEWFARSSQRALDGVFQECARQPSCHRAFPHLDADWAALWRSVNQEPWVVPADRSPSGERLVLDADWVATSIHRLLFVATTHVDIPFAVHTLATASDRVGALLAISAAIPPDSGSSGDTSQLLPFVTRCSEKWAQDDPARLAGADSYHFQVDLSQARWWQAVCAQLPRSVGADETQEPDPRLPVLAFNGALDPQDPPANIVGGKDFWPNSALLTVPGQGHDIDPASAGCEIPIISSFIERGSPVGLDTTCLKQLSGPTFALGLSQLH